MQMSHEILECGIKVAVKTKRALASIMVSFRRTGLVSVLLLTAASALDVSRTLTPPMGWNSYNHYSCYADETIIKANAKAMVDLGLAEVGYTYVVPDCGWRCVSRFSPSSVHGSIDHR